MPTAIATLGREKRIATLARKVFVLERGADPALQRRAEAALLKANPRLARPEGYRVGAKVIVPRTPGLRRTPDVVVARAEGKGLTGETALRLQAAASQIDDRFQQATDRAEKDLSRIQDREFLASAKKALPESTDLLAKTEERLKREMEESGDKAARFQSGLEKALEAVDVLEKLGNRQLPR